MIPILYEGTEQSFTSNGLGRLSDAISCKVVEERNATYELEMTYPITGVHFDDIQEGRIILAQPFDGGLTQPFTIYQISKPLNQVVTIKAQHISYQLSGIVVMPFEASSCTAAIAGIKSNSASSNPFNFMTDKQVTANFSVTAPTAARALLCGQQGSLLDVYGKGDYEFNRFDVNLRVNRGADNGVTLRYGKNITDLKNVIDMTNVYTGIVPYWMDGEGNTVTLPEKVVQSGHESDYPFQIIKSVDFSSNWENEPTQAQLRTAAQNYVESNEGWKLKNNITVSFVALWNTEEYKNIAPLERVKMCDTVHVQVPKFGIDFSTKVVKTDYNVLLEKYNSITLGDTYYTLSTVFNEEIASSEERQTSHMQKAIARATKLIQGGLGGHVVFNVNADGEPQEILIMDTDDIQTAVNVIRMNLAGIGFSTHGYNGPFNTAWTIDGHFVADYIDTGTLHANLIKTGLLQDAAGVNYWNMDTGDFRLTSAAKIGNSTIASVANVSAAVVTAEQYADTHDGITLNAAETYADTQDGVTLAAAKVYADNGVTNYDTYLNQTRVFNKLTNNGAAQGIYMTNGQLYINGTYIKTGTLDASLVNVTNLNASNINTGTLQDSSGNTKWNLSTGALSSKKFSIDSTYFQLSEAGAITSIDPDGRKIVVDKGTISGFKSNGQLSAELEVGNGLFNIKTGQLAIQGFVGVSGNTSFVKSIDYETVTLWDNVPIGSGYQSQSVCGSGITLGTSGTSTVYTQAQTVWVNVPAEGGLVAVSIPSQSIQIPAYTISNKDTKTFYAPTAVGPVSKTYLKAVSASSGSINSKYGIIQSIS